MIPLKDLEVLWILIPVWINFLFTEFFQEREGTSLGNAVTNGAIMLWVGIDWIRFLVRNYKGFSGLLALKILLCVLCILGGFLIIYEGIKGKAVIRRIARVREVTYVMLVLSPLIYGLIDPNLKYLLSIIIFAPLFYFFFELLDLKILPGADTYKEKYGD